MNTTTSTAGVRKETRSAGLVRLKEFGAITLPKKKAAPAPKTAEPTSPPALEAAMKRITGDENIAKLAANGRTKSSTPVTSLAEAGKARGFSASKAKAFSKGRGVSEAVTKHEDPSGNFKGGDFPPADYAYVGDRADPETWALLLTLVPGDMPDPDSVKAAVQAIDPSSPAKNPVPAADLADVKRALISAWTKAGLPADELPVVLTTEALRRAFIRGGLSEKAAAIASRGRERSK